MLSVFRKMQRGSKRKMKSVFKFYKGSKYQVEGQNKSCNIFSWSKLAEAFYNLLKHNHKKSSCLQLICISTVSLVYLFLLILRRVCKPFDYRKTVAIKLQTFDCKSVLSVVCRGYLIPLIPFPPPPSPNCISQIY